MKLLIAIVIIAVVTLVGSRVTFSNRRLPIGLRNILFTGTEYIFIGLLLGRYGLKILDQETLYNLNSILLFGLAWIGFLYGLQFEIRLLRSLPHLYFSITAIQSVITFLTVSFCFYFLLRFFLELPQGTVFLSAITLGAVSSCTAQSAIAIVSQNYRIKNRGLLELMRYISSVDGLFALLFFALALCIMPNGEIGDILQSLKWLFISVLLGIIPGLILIILSKTRFTNQEYVLFLVGTVLFCGGLAQRLNYSPLISGMICGVVTANFCKHRLRALQMVVKAEKSIYILLLLIIGALWHIRFDISLLLGGLYFLVRIIGKFIGVFTATHLYKPQYKVPPTLGLGLISEGGLAIAIILNFRFLFPSAADSLITIVVLSVLVSEFVSPKLILGRFESEEIVIKNITDSTVSR